MDEWMNGWMDGWMGVFQAMLASARDTDVT
jgi:hypothetical protein